MQCAAPRRPLRIGLVVWPVYEIAVLARSLGRLDSKRVHLLDYGSNSEALRAYQNGVIDGVALTTSYVIELLALSSNDRIVLVIDVSTGGDALVASANIKSVRDLKGRRIGLETGSLGLLVLSRALEHGELAKTDVHVVPVDASGQQAAFNAGAVDAVVTYEPMRSTLVARGARDIFNSSMMPNEIVDVLVVRESAVREREQALTHLTDAWFYALDYLRRHPVDAAARVAPRENLTADAYLASLKGVQILGSRGKPTVAQRRSTVVGRSSGIAGRCDAPYWPADHPSASRLHRRGAIHSVNLKSRRFPPLLRYSVPAMMLGIAIAMLWVSYIVETSAARRRVEEETARRLRLLGSVLSDDIENAVRNGQQARLSTTIAHARSDPDVTLAVLFDGSNQVIASSDYMLRSVTVDKTPFARVG